MKYPVPTLQTRTSTIHQTWYKGCVLVGSTYYYVTKTASAGHLYKATSFLAAGETAIGDIESTLADIICTDVRIYAFTNTVIYVVASFYDASIAAGGNDVQYVSKKYTIATSTWAAIGSVTIASGCEAATRSSYVSGQWVINAGTHFITTIHKRKAGGLYYWRTTCYSSNFGASSTMDSAAGATCTAVGGRWNETAAKYYWLYYESGIGWVFKYATTAPTINNDDSSVAEYTLTNGYNTPILMNYAITEKGSRIILSDEDLAIYNFFTQEWTEVSDATHTDDPNAIGYLGDEPVSIIAFDSYYFKIGDTWCRIYASIASVPIYWAANTVYCGTVDTYLYDLVLTTLSNIKNCKLRHPLYAAPTLSFDFVVGFTPFSRQVLMLYNDNDDWMGAYDITIGESSGGFTHATGLHIIYHDLTKDITTSIVTSTSDEHLSEIILDFCEMAQEGSLDAYVTDRDIEYNSNLLYITYLLSMFESAVVYWFLWGEITMDDGTTDTGENLVFGTDRIISVVRDITYRKPRYIRVLGGFVGGVQLESYYPMYVDGSPIQITFPNILSQTDVDTLAENIAVMMDVDAQYYRVKFSGYKFITPGMQVTFAYGPLSVASAQYYVIEVTYDLTTNINEVLLCSHLILPNPLSSSGNFSTYISRIENNVNDPTGDGITPKQIKLNNADATITEFDSDVTLAGGNTKVPTDLAVKTYVDAVTTAFQAADTALTTALNAGSGECIIPPLGISPEAGWVLGSGLLGAAWQVAINDVNATIRSSHYVKKGGSFKVRVILYAAANCTLSGLLYLRDQGVGSALSWDLANGVNWDTAAIVANQIYYHDSGAYTIANDQSVGVAYVKDNNGGGSASLLYCFGIVLVRQ